jgi:hypothetical protein
MEVGGQRHAPAVFPAGKRPVIQILQEAGWDPEPLWTGAGIMYPQRFEPRTVQLVANRVISMKIQQFTNLQSVKVIE